MSPALQVIGAILRIGQWPALFLAPDIRSHNKNAHRLFLLHTILNALEPVIEPALVQIGKQVSSETRCTIVAFLEAPQKVAMRPGTNHQVLKLAGKGTASPLLHALIILQVLC